MNRRLLVGLVALVSGCSHGPASLSPAATAVLALPADAHGALIYVGEVTAIGDLAPSYRYERRRHQAAAGVTTTHVTRSLTGDVAVVQQATTDGTGVLQRYSEIHAQTATTAHVVVNEATKTVHYVVVRDGAETATTESVQAPIVVGPTLFPFVVARRAQLVGGETVALQFVVASAGQSYRFALTGEATSRGFRASMRASNPLVALFVAPVEVEFVDDDTGLHVAHYQGRIPPLCAGRVCDGEVRYRAEVPFE